MKDYLKFLYRHIDSSLSGESLLNKAWVEAYVDLNFSVPTAWSPEVLHNFRHIIRCAGFAELSSHSLNINVREAAAAVTYRYYEVPVPGPSEGAIYVLSCLSGEDTITCCILHVKRLSGIGVQYQQLFSINGYNIGDSHIDQELRILCSNAY
jgi:hypothetical protein